MIQRCCTFADLKAARCRLVKGRGAWLAALMALSACFCTLSLNADDEPMSLIAPFVEALQHDDLAAFDSVAGGAVADDDNDWLDVRNFVDLYRCVTVRQWSASVEEADDLHTLFRLTLDGTAMTMTAHPREVPLPADWMLQEVRSGNGWSISIALQRERYLARQIAVSKTSGHDDILAATRIADPGRLLKELADIATDSGNPKRYGYASFEEADCHFRRLLDEALTVAQEIGDPLAEASCLRLLAYVERGEKPAASLRDSTRALELAIAAGQPDDIARGFFTQGLDHWYLGDHDAAIRSLEQTAALLDSLDDPRIAMKALAMSGYIALLHNDVRGALSASQRLIFAARRFEWKEGEAVGLSRTADIHMVLRDYELAASENSRAYELLKANRDNGMVASIATARATCARALGDRKSALTFLREAEQSGRLLGAPLASVCLDEGSVLMESGRLDEAETKLRKALRICPPTEDGVVASDSFVALSRLYLLRHKPLAALRNAEEAVSAGDGVGRFEFDWSPWQARTVLALALRAAGRRTEAVTAFRQAIDFIEAQQKSLSFDEIGKSRYFDERTEPYIELTDLLVELGRPREAFAVAERAKARSLEETLRQSHLDSELSTAEQQKRDDLDQRLVTLNRQILSGQGDTPLLRRNLNDARVEWERFQVEAAISHPELRIQTLNVRPAGALAVPAGLRDAVVIEYVVSRAHTIVFALTQSGKGPRIAARVINVSRAQLDREVGDFRARIERRDYDGARLARSLYDLLLGPVEALIEGHKLLVVVPHDILWRVPFQALLRPDETYIIQRQAVAYAPSLAMLRASEDRHLSAKVPPGELLAFGDPTIARSTAEGLHALYRDAALGQLPEAAKEVRALGGIYDAKRSRVYTGDAARESTFKAEAAHYRVLHLAMHAILNGSAPMYSGLIMNGGGDSREDGVLEAREILGMSLSADVAVLSACETARGTIGVGEGVVGMSWAFLAAGCPTTVVSEWRAESSATEMLMIEFHRRLVKGESKAEALRGAALALMRIPRYAHCFYWADFIVVGAPN